MNLHEYQAKKLLGEYGISVSFGFAVDDADSAVKAADKIEGNRWIIKAQVHAGGRGKAGGVKLVSSHEEIRDFCKKFLHKRLITYQTDQRGQPVNKILLEACCAIDQELYLGAVIDRSQGKVVFMASNEGGVEIEKVAAQTPDKIFSVALNPLVGGLPFQGRHLAFKLGLKGQQIKQFSQLFVALSQLFVEKDLALLEINPLVITSAGNLQCLDAKISIDSNAMHRQPALLAMRDKSQEEERELRAAQWDLNYIALEGNIGCMVNGAGLAMATMDLIKLHGGNPANFLDVGGGATKERVEEAFKIILSDDKVQGILVNIFGGIVRCDLIAEGIIAAVGEVGVNVPVVVRLAGNNAQLASEHLEKSGLNIIAASSFDEAAKKVVKVLAANS